MGLDTVLLPKLTTGVWSTLWKKTQKAFHTFLKVGPTPGDHTNKWARPLPLYFATNKLLAKIGVFLSDGYKTYPDNFNQEFEKDIFSRVDHLPWQFLNPPYNASGSNCLENHIAFWIKPARVSRAGHVLIFPHLPFRNMV